MGTINQRNKTLEGLYFYASDALAGMNLDFSIIPHGETPVYYEFTVKGYFTYRGNYKQIESFIAGLMVGIDIVTEMGNE